VAGRDIELHGPGRAGPDIIESAPRRPLPGRTVLAAFALAVVVAAAGGYVAGQRHPSTPAPKPSALARAEAISGTGDRCSVQQGRRLQLGTEIANRSTEPVTLQYIAAKLPLGGLRATARAWGSCGQLPSAVTAGRLPLAVGATTWLTMTFDVLVPCPAPLPVLFTVEYAQSGRSGVADVPAFPDLGDVPYRGGDCRND
jgi:hypothetical protein